MKGRKEMKRKITAILCFGAMLLSLCACSESVDKNSGENKNNTSSVVDSVPTTTADNQEDQTVVDGVHLDGGIYRVPTYDIYIRVPNYHPKENGCTYLLSDKNNIIIAVAAVWVAKGSTLEQAQKDVVDNYILEMKNYATIKSLTVENDEYLTINGIDMYKFEGKLNCTAEIGDYDLYTIGYTFIMDGIPCCVQGTVFNKEHPEDYLKPQPEEMINTTRDTVNAMIKTLRSSL